MMAEPMERRAKLKSSAKALTELLPQLPRLSTLHIIRCGKITQLVVGVDLQQITSAASEVEEDEAAAAELTVGQEKEDDGVLLFPAHLADSLRELVIYRCPELVLVAQPTLLPDGHNKKTGGGGGLQVLRSLRRLEMSSPKFLPACSFSSPTSRLFPSSLQHLDLSGVGGMGTLEPLSNLTSLTQLHMADCGEDLRCEGLQHLLTTGGQLTELTVRGSPRFFAGWDPNPVRVLQDEEGGEEQQL